MPETRSSPRYLRRLILVAYATNIAGTVGLPLYFNLIHLPLPSGVVRGPVTVPRALVLVSVQTIAPYLFFTYSVWRICRGLQHWQDRLDAGLAPADVPLEVRRRVLMLVPQLTRFGAATWLVASLISIVLSPKQPGGILLGAKVALGIAATGGVVSTTILYFAGDLTWRPAVNIFFPDGRLSSVSPRSRSTFGRLLFAFLLAGVWMPSLAVLAPQSYMGASQGGRRMSS